MCKLVGPVMAPVFFLNDMENGTVQKLPTSSKDKTLVFLQFKHKGI